MDNIEALADESDYCCFLYKEQCFFLIETYEQEVLMNKYINKNIPGFPHVSIGVMVDLTDITTIISTLPGGVFVHNCGERESMPCARLFHIIFNQ